MRYFKPLLLTFPKADLKLPRRVNPFGYFLPFKKLKKNESQFPWHADLSLFIKKKKSSQLRSIDLINSKKFKSTTLVFPSSIEPKRLLDARKRRLLYWWVERTEEDKRRERTAAARRRREGQTHLLRDVLLNLKVNHKTPRELIERNFVFRALAHKIEAKLYPDTPTPVVTSNAETGFKRRPAYGRPGETLPKEERRLFWDKLQKDPSIDMQIIDKLTSENLKKIKRNSFKLPLSSSAKNSFDIQFLRKEFVYTKLKYSRCPAYDAVSGGFAALFAGFVGFLISEKFGIELVDSGDFYIVLMYVLIAGFSGRLLLSCTSLSSTPYLPISLRHNMLFFKELFKFLFQTSRWGY